MTDLYVAYELENPLLCICSFNSSYYLRWSTLIRFLETSQVLKQKIFDTYAGSARREAEDQTSRESR